MKRDCQALSADTFDLLIVGAGIHGIFAAWDAAQRGLRVALVDKGDFCGATSSNSLRIVHGGLRYLQQADLRRMRLSIRERRTLLHIAPHLVRPLACIMPTTRKLLRSRTVMRCALAMNDLIGFDRNRGVSENSCLPPGRILNREECLRAIPGVAGDDITGGALWWDAQMLNSERLALNVLHLAVAAGAVGVNYFEIQRYLRKGSRVVGAHGRDLVSDNAQDVRARCVLNTVGPWIHELLAPEFLGGIGKTGWSSAMNLVLRRAPLREHAFGVGRGDDRLFFVVPWNGVTVVGTTHFAYEGSPSTFRVTHADVERFVAEVDAVYPSMKLRTEDVSFYHAGLLPSTSSDCQGRAQLLKHHRLIDHSRVDGVEGLLSLVGVKWTTARALAELAVDAVFRKLGASPPPCRTGETQVRGSGSVCISEIEALGGIGNRAARLLARDHGSAYQEVLRYQEQAPGTLPGDLPVLRAEVLYGIREEMAVHLADIVFRRTVLGSRGDPGHVPLQACAGLLARELGWSSTRLQSELADVHARFLPTCQG